jgi:hypothetical protein
MQVSFSSGSALGRQLVVRAEFVYVCSAIERWDT